MEGVPEQNEISGEKIVLTEDRDILSMKLEEYKGRHPHQAPEVDFRNTYKIEVLQSLLDKGVIDREEIANEIEEKYGPLDLSLFDSAWKVIKGYVEDGGKHLRGGTGLPKRPEANIDEGEMR